MQVSVRSKSRLLAAFTRPLGLQLQAIKDHAGSSKKSIRLSDSPSNCFLKSYSIEPVETQLKGLTDVLPKFQPSGQRFKWFPLLATICKAKHLKRRNQNVVECSRDQSSTNKSHHVFFAPVSMLKEGNCTFPPFDFLELLIVRYGSFGSFGSCECHTK